jgi:hypothetical protein
MEGNIGPNAGRGKVAADICAFRPDGDRAGRSGK